MDSNRSEVTRDPTRGTSAPTRLWTFSNIAEACPLVLSPLCWTVWLPANELGFREAYFRMGIIRRDEVRLPEDPNERIASCFYGRMAINVDRLSALISTIPGSSPEDFERDFLGYVREDRPPFERSRARLPFMLARMPGLLLTHGRNVSRVHDDQLRWWRSEVLPTSTSRAATELLRESTERFRVAMAVHCVTRSLLQPIQAQLGALADKAGDASLANQIFAGLGGVPEMDLAADLWEVSRERLGIAEFIRRHGFHGPFEGNPIGRSWREDPKTLEPLLSAYRDRSEAESPRERERKAAAAHGDAVASLMGAVGRVDRARARILIKRARAQIRLLEVGKASFVMGIDGARAAARRIGADGVKAGRFEAVDDVFYLTLDELTRTAPVDPAELIAFRKARREEYEQFELPVTFSGMPEPLVRADESDEDRTGLVLEGVAGSHGVAEGKVRVILDPAGDETIEADEILVCHITDPSWAALFTIASALVIDIGAAASHGAIVAREMGIPCVIGTGDGSRRLRTGDRVRVDGSAGRVEVLALVSG